MTISRKPFLSWVFERFRGLQVLLFVLILGTIFFRVFPLEMQKRIVNQAIALKKVDVLLIYCGLYMGAVFLAGVLKYVINVLQEYIGQKILLDMRSKLYDHILSLPLSFFRKTPPGTVIASLTSELAVVGEFMGGAIAVPVINVLTLLTFAAYMAHLNPLLALLSLSMYPVEILLIPFLQRKFNQLNMERIEVTRSLSNVVNEAISGMHEIHGNASYQLEGVKMARFAVPLFHLRNRMNKVKYLIKFTNNFFQSLGPFFLFLVGGYLTIQGRLDLGALVAFLSAYEKLYDPWKELMDYYQSYQDSKVRYRQVMEAFDARPEFILVPEETREPYRMRGHIEVEDLGYVAEGRVRILDQVSLDIKPGEQVAIVGLSGSGKSTLAMVLGQLYGYTSGRVLVDGVELKTLSRLVVSRNIGYVAQYPFIFNGTIMENVLYGHMASRHANESSNPVVDRGEVFRMLDHVGLTEDVLKMGLNARLSVERDQEFAQRLVFSRELYHEKHGDELAEVVDFFVVNQFQHYSSLMENIVFGHPNDKGRHVQDVSRDPSFKRFLQEIGLMAPLVDLGEELAVQTVALLRDLREDSFFFEMSPIGIEEFEKYEGVVSRVEKSGRDRITRRDREALVDLALHFVPARHKMAALPHSLEAAILDARKAFITTMLKKDPGAFTFYHAKEYFYSQSILNNLLFGNFKEEQPQTVDMVRESVVEVLREQGLIDEVTAAGLEFQVGSKGDRLSGGQRQKIAMARAFLKNTPILILDEATASLDNTSQAHIQQMLSGELKGRHTLVAVVHRLEMLKGFDAIAVMKAGRIVEMGRYDELIARKGDFYELARGA